MQRVLNYLLIMLFCLMLVHTLVYLAFGVALIPFPFDYDQAEGFELNNAVLLASGRCPYCNNDVFPFYGSGYPPLFHALMVPFVKLFGPQFWYGRLMIFGATLVTALAIAWAVFRDSRHRMIATIAGLAFLSSNYVYHIGPLLRQHLLMVMFETLAVVTIASAFEPRVNTRRRLFVAFALLLCAGYTKQLAYTSCIAVSFWLFLRNPRAAIQYSLVLALAAGAIFALLMLVTDGHWWINIISANQNPYRMDQFLGLLQQFLRLHGWLFALAIGMVMYEMYFDRLSVFSIWFVAAFINTSAAGKWGAGDSYFVTALAAICILSGIFLARSVAGVWHVPGNYLARFLKTTTGLAGGKLLALSATILFLAYGISVFKLPTSGQFFAPIASALNIQPLPSWRYPLYDPAGWTVGYAITGHLPSQDDYDRGWEIVDAIKQTDGLLLSEDAGFNLRSGREVIANAIQLKNLWENGLFDPTELIKTITSRSFALVIIRAGLFPHPVMIAIHNNYQLDQIISMNGFDYQLWTPQRSASAGDN